MTSAAVAPGIEAGPPAPTPATAPFDLVVADASWTWTERLFTPLADLGVRVLLLKACDWRTAWNARKPLRDWFGPTRRLAPNLWERQLVLPPGWMKTCPQLGMRPIARAVRAWRAGLEAPRPLALAISYPHYLYLSRQLAPAALLYYNMDDYACYWSARGEAIRRLERRVVHAADLSIFCARVRAEELTAAVPSAADRIVHLPHGSPAAALGSGPQHRPARPPADLADLPRPLLGFVGSLEDRIDWPLVDDLARAFPGGSVVLVGREPEPAPRQPWYAAYERAIARPNVHRLGWRPQAELPRYTRAFDCCLIPYRADHPFNRACCPTKIMDYMATGRPVVATDLPECRLYDGLFSIAPTRGRFLDAVRAIVDRGSDDGQAARRWDLGRQSTWARTAAVLLDEFRDRVSWRFDPEP